MAAIRNRTARRRRSNSAAPTRASRACWKASWSRTRRCKQVVAKTYEVGLRGNGALARRHGRMEGRRCSAPTAPTTSSTWRARSRDAACSRMSPRRAARASKPARVSARTTGSLYANYSYIDATYQFTGDIASPNNPSADDNGNVHVMPGKHIPGIPQHQFKAGAEYAVTSHGRSAPTSLWSAASISSATTPTRTRSCRPIG